LTPVAASLSLAHMSLKPIEMRQSAWDYLLKFTEFHEGPIRHMYNAKGAEVDVTIGIGISLPTEGSAASPDIVALCFDPATKLPATAAQMKADWNTASEMMIAGNARIFNASTGELKPFAEKCLMRMSLETVRSSVQKKLAANFKLGKNTHKDHYPDFETYPAEAQVAIASFNYGIPAMNTFPNLSSAISAGDWLWAAGQCKINGASPRKNKGHEVLFTNAARVVEQGLDLDSIADVSKVDPPLLRPFVPYDILDLDTGTTTRVTQAP
jgi:hypothetical protein